MAETSGIIQTNVLDGTYFWVKWSVKTQGLVNNNPVTTINWSCGVYTAHNYYLNAIKMSAFTINGTQVYGGGTYSNFSRLTNNTLAYGELSIPHNSDGTKSLSVSSFSGWIYDTGSPSAIGKSFTLPSIAVKAIITSAPNFNDNSNPTISYNNAAGSSVHELHACISLTGATDDVVYREVSKTGNSYTFNLTEEERNTLRNAAAGNPPSRSVFFFLRTRMTATSAYSYSTEERTFTVVPSDATNPTESIGVSAVSSLPSAFAGLYVQGKVKAGVTHTATFKNGATAASYTTSVADKTYSGASVTTDYINTAGSVTITGTVKDSRGFTASDSKTIEVIPYTKPAVAQIPGLQEIVCARCDEDGNLSASGTYLKVRCSRRYSTVTSGGVQKNFCLLRLRVNSGSWKTLITRTAAGDTYDGVVPGVTLNVDSVYTIQIEAVDDIGEVHDIYFDIPTEEVPFHMGEGGLNIGVGRYANMESSERVDVAWDTYFERELYVRGKTLIDLIYPVGSLYISANSTNPSTLFGGTWEQVKDRFLLAAGDTYSAGTTGGEAAHTLTENEMPSHRHDVAENADANYKLLISGNGGSQQTGVNLGTLARTTVSSAYLVKSIAAGSGQAHNNMPPYLTVYVWKRTA